MSKILVTGGTGLLGSHLLFELVKSGVKPIAIKRKTSDVKKVLNLFSLYTTKAELLFNMITWKTCNILDLLELNNIVKDVTQIYHCASLVSFNPKLKNKIIDTNYIGTSNIVNLALKHNISKLCHVSSISTFSSNKGKAINEDCFWSWENKSPYAISKHLAEMEIWRGIAEGLNATIVNPSIIIGPGEFQNSINNIIKVIKKKLPFYPSGSCGIIDVKDLVKIMIQLMEKSIHSEQFIISSHNIKYKELLQFIANQVNIPPPKFMVGKIAINILLKIYHVINFFKKNTPKLHVDSLRRAHSKIVLDSSKIQEKLFFEYTDYRKSILEAISLLETKH